MTDIFTKAQRSKIMSLVKGKGTKPEITLGKLLFSNGFRFKKNVKSLPGKPDIVIHKYRTAIFVNGCFWHGHKNCDASTLPKSNQSYWVGKINSNIKRDKKNVRLLKKIGWNVIVIWECQISKLYKEDKRKHSLILKIKK